jgi:hypothetical protein
VRTSASFATARGVHLRCGRGRRCRLGLRRGLLSRRRGLLLLLLRRSLLRLGRVPLGFLLLLCRSLLRLGRAALRFLLLLLLCGAALRLLLLRA